MTRILHIQKSDSEDMSSFERILDETLTGIGLEKVGRLGKWDSAGPSFPSTHAFQSQGEGGFVFEYDKSSEVYLDSSRRDTVRVDLSIIPIGATGSLVQRTYEHLKRVSTERGYACFERRVTRD